MKKTITLLLFCMMCVALMGSVLAEGIELLADEMHETYEADGAALVSLDASFPQLAGMEDEAAMERINAAIRDNILTGGEYDNIREYALDDYTNAPERFAENKYGLTANVRAELLRGDTLLAVRYDFILETGGPHPWEVIAARHFDLSTGMPVALETLIRDPDAVRSRVVMDTLGWIEESGFDAFDNAEECAREWPLKNALLTGKGLLVLYSEGELGPVSEGAAEILIPYERLQGLLN